ncbi:MAG: RNA polymerase sigma factor [Planctomycetota bacterium]
MGLVITEHDLQQYMRQHGPGLLAVARGICRDAGAAEDVVQEAFVKLWRTPPDGPEKVVPSWLRRVVVNLSINHLRRHKRSEELPDWAAESGHDGGDQRHQRAELQPHERMEADDNRQRIEQALSSLPADKRAILLLRARQNLSYQELAEVFGVPVGTIMSRLNRARNAMQDALAREEGFADGSDTDTAGPIPFPGSSAEVDRIMRSRVRSGRSGDHRDGETANEATNVPHRRASSGGSG